MPGAFPIGGNPRGVAFDRGNIWVTNETDNTVSKLLASDGALPGIFAVGAAPMSVVFARENIWVTSRSDHTVSKL